SSEKTHLTPVCSTALRASVRQRSFAAVGTTGAPGIAELDPAVQAPGYQVDQTPCVASPTLSPQPSPQDDCGRTIGWNHTGGVCRHVQCSAVGFPASARQVSRRGPG